jgi:glucose/arabinose dehydrogenase
VEDDDDLTGLTSLILWKPITFLAASTSEQEMTMAKRILSMLTAVLTVFWTLFPATTGFAHCPGSVGPPAYLETFFAPINASGTKIKLELVTSGLTAPLKGTVAPGLPNYLFVVDQPGILWAVNLTTGAKTPFLNVANRLVTLGVLGPNTFDERGLLGLAFHPNYQQNGLLYTYTSEPTAGLPTFPTTIPMGSTPDHQNVVAEWQAVNPANPAAGVNPASRRELMRVDWPQFNHDGGDLAFGPDGFLYISMGDGGGADDADGQLFIVADGSLPANEAPIIGHQGDGNAQKLNTPLGKILRIDVNGHNSANGQYGIPADNPFVGAPGLDEIFAFGFRNPFRFSFDSATGALFVGDVGQNDIEEVDVVVKGGNYGWNAKEGTLFFHINGNAEGFGSDVLDNGRTTPEMIDPVAQYDTHGEGHSVIGGFVYHGSRIPQLRDRYVFAEFSRVFNFPSGPHNFGRLLYLAQKHTDKKQLLNINEFNDFSGAIADVGLSVGPAACDGEVPPTLAVLGMGQDAQGEVYTMGNISGVPFGSGGVLLRLAPPGKK